MMHIPAQPIQVFYSYAHKDEIFRRELEKHLSNLRQQGFIQEWHDRMIVAGTDWAFDIDTHLNSSAIILLLISPDFMESDYCLSIEMTRAMELHKAGEAYVIPILLRPVDWEGAPFARLQVLPSGARPITLWEDLDQAFLNVSRGIRQVIEQLRSGGFAPFTDASQDITRLPGETTSDFIALENYLKPSRLRFPTKDDFEHDLIYVPEKQLIELMHLLHEKRRVLLIGSQASGKTVLAIALAKQLQEHDTYKVAYKDAEKVREGEGRKWYQLMRGHDRKGVLYLLDNCHLAPEEVNEFCQQWEEQPLEHAQCLLISRVHTGEEEAWTTYRYFEACGDATMKTRSEEIYWGMLEKYATYYQSQHPERYASLAEDEAKLLKRQHAHNLVVSKSRLEAWSEIGGRLSEVKQETIYTTMIRRYCSRWKEALPQLCALRQYEIRAHNFFVESHLPRQEVQQLQEERLLTAAPAQNYGMLYDLAFHPAEARELFEAYLYYRYGRVTSKNLRNSTLEALRTYLGTSPLNYMEVYDRLVQQKQKRMLERLLRDTDLQECAARQFETGNLLDAISYLFRLAKIDSPRAHVLLAQLIEEIGMRDVCTRIIEYSFQEAALLLQKLQKIEHEVARQIVSALKLERYIKHVGEQNLQSLFQLVQVLNAIIPSQGHALLISIPLETLLVHITTNNFYASIEQLRELGYPSAQVKQVVELLNVDVLIEQYEHAQRANLAHFYRIVHTCKAIVPAKARMLLENMPLELLARRASTSTLNQVSQMVDIMRELQLPQTYSEHFIGLIGVEWVIQRAETENLQHLYWILRSFQRISSMMANTLLEALSPTGLAVLCRAHEASIDMVGQFNKVSTKQFWQHFLRQFTPEDMVVIFNRSLLGPVGSFLKHRYFYFRQSYQLFFDRFLKDHFRTEPLEEIGTFLASIKQIPEVGNDLAYDAVRLLAEVDIAERVAGADLEPFALLLHHSKEAPAPYLFQLLKPLLSPDVMRTALEKSELNSIQRLIYNVAGIDRTAEKRYIRAIERGLHTADLRKGIARADLAAKTKFLTNVSNSMNAELAQEYRQFIDSKECPI